MEPECECGHAEDEHDEVGECTVEGCGCFHFDPIPEEDDDR